MIEFKEIVKSYDNKQIAVNHLNLKINDGEFCVLLGESGCGKSTTLNMVNRLIEPDSGDIFVNGKNIKDIQVDTLRRGMGYVVQSISLFPNMTIEKNVATVPELLKWDKARIAKRVRELVSMVGLDPDIYLKKYPAQLSGGEAQRVGVARALAADPDILLMDEPFGAVDPLNRTMLQNEFLKLQARLHKTVIFVTHDILEAMRMGDRIALMSKGVLEGYGTPSELLLNKENDFIRGFLGYESYISILNKYTAGRSAVAGIVEPGMPVVNAETSLHNVLAIMIENACDSVKVDDGQVVTINEILTVLNDKEVVR